MIAEKGEGEFWRVWMFVIPTEAEGSDEADGLSIKRSAFTARVGSKSGWHLAVAEELTGHSM